MWRDNAKTWPADKQQRVFEKCMQQDCEQNLIQQAGCRFLDEDGFCYAWTSTQNWCIQNSDDDRCNDGGADWGWKSTGLGSATGDTTAWEPQTSVALYEGGEEVSRYGCACLKNCACTFVPFSAQSCRCTSGAAEIPVGDKGVAFPVKRIAQNKDGSCACKCNAVSYRINQSPGDLHDNPGKHPKQGSAEARAIAGVYNERLHPSGGATVRRPKFGEGQGGSLINHRCYMWRDKAKTWLPAKQADFYEKCMEQDCEQSLENTRREPGCRFVDQHGFCYINPATQMYCAKNPSDYRCNDGGADWGWKSTGLGSATGDTTAWEPQTSVALYEGGKEVSRYGCACLKNCQCSWAGDPSCRCTSGSAEAAVGDASVRWPYKRYTTNRSGRCACKCSAVTWITDHGAHARPLSAAPADPMVQFFDDLK